MAEEESTIGGALDIVEQTVTKGISGTLFNIVKKVGGNTLQVIGDKRQAGKAAQQYRDRYEKRYGLLKLLGMPQGVALESVYTPVRVLNELSIRQFETIDDLESIYRGSQKRRLQSGELLTENGITVADRHKYLMVLGNPGGGKSTFLRRLGLEALNEDRDKFLHDCIPVMLELNQFASHQVDLVEAISEEFSLFGFPDKKEFTIKALKEGKLMVLLDGLDEVPNQFTNSVMQAIDDLVTRYEKNRFISSCRIAAYRSDLKHNFQVIELADFDDNQIQQFINNWFSTELDIQSQTAAKCWETLNDDRNQAAKELAQTPLLLTFLCLVYNRKQSFPPTRSRLYNKALDILLEEWAAEKRLNQEPIHEGLHTDLEKVMLAQIAYKGFEDDWLFFDEQQIIKSITDFLADSVENPKYLDGKKILKAIAAQQGILVQRAEDVYSFSHLTLQEYLTAKFLNEDDALVQQLISQHLTDKRWREVFLLVAGIKDDASKFLLDLEKATQKLIDTDKLHNLLIWTRQRTNNSPGDFQTVGKRAIALANPYANPYANSFANSFALVYANSNVSFYTLTNPYPYASAEAIEYFIGYVKWVKKFQIYQDMNYGRLIRTLEILKQQISDEQNSREVRKVFHQKIRQISLESFKLQREMINLSIREVQALDDYFYANLLMVECRAAAVRVSRRTWSEIESRMFMPFKF